MNFRNLMCVTCLWTLAGVQLTVAESGNYFVAYSLKEAERLMASPSAQPSELKYLGSITRLVGAVYDDLQNDVILVGAPDSASPKLTLDDFVVGLRAVLKQKAWPLVSIDKTAETDATHIQHVRFDGGIEGTALGQALLEADVLLKKLALGIVPTDIWKIPSYFDLSYQQAKQHCVSENVSSRFWFYPLKPVLATRQGVCALKKQDICVFAQVMTANSNGTVIKDVPGEKFAAGMTTTYNEAMKDYPELRRLTGVFDLIAIVAGIDKLALHDSLRYWLDQYPVHKIQIETSYPVLRREQELQTLGTSYLMEVSGGVEAQALIIRVQDGDLSALREVVLKSRPASDTLVWSLPIRDWNIISRGKTEETSSGDMVYPAKEIGCSVTRTLQPKGASTPFTMTTSENFHAKLEFPQFETTEAGPPLGMGGVSMQFKVEEESFRVDHSGTLERLRKNIQDSRPSGNELYWESGQNGDKTHEPSKH